jgi:hypothetical protein
MKQRIRKALAYLALVFVLLFCIRLGYGYLKPSQQSVLLSSADALSEGLTATIGGRADFRDLKANYATARVKVEQPGLPKVYSVDQKYEKIATMTSVSNGFEDDEKRVRDATTRYSALIQFEQSTGLPGSRTVNLDIGVPPDRLDPIVEEL